jgi:cytochrome c oxidase cbb3-type subunit 3
MTLKERDPHTGYLTTGHEWNGIKELNTPVPRPVLFFLAVTFLFSVVYWVLMPAWPIGSTFTRGMLGIDQRTSVARDLEEARALRAGWEKRIETGSYAAIQADDGLMRIVRTTGRTLFGDNCAVCHGVNGTGGPGFPDLAAGSWLWGGTPEAIARTIQVGINATHDDTRVSQMPAFGRDGMLPRKEIDDVIVFVRSLSDPSVAADSGAERVAAGRAVFAANCASCHGENAKGNIEMGAPDLTDAHWIYGGSPSAIAETLYAGRQGQMPTWEGRLSPLDRKILTLYVLDLGRRQP